jgi:hypothetical protein
MLTSRKLSWFWRGSLAILGLGVPGIYFLQIVNPALLVSARSVLFTRYVTASMFNSVAASESGLRGDDIALINEWRSRIQRDPALASTLIDAQKVTNPVERAKILIKDFSNGGIGNNGCATALSLAAKMKATGCCSDYSEVFLAWAALTGIRAREVSNEKHTIVEVLDPRVRKWILVDPTYQLMIYDAEKQPLSLLGVRDRVIKGEPISIVRFGKVPKDAGTSAKDIADDYQAAAFADISLTDGVNVFQEDAFLEDLRPMPKSFARLVGFLLNITPGYLVVRDRWNETRVARFVAIRDTFWVAFGVLWLFVLSFPLFKATDRVSELLVLRLSSHAAASTQRGQALPANLASN